MKQISLASTGFQLVTKRTRKREFLDEMTLVVPWSELVGLIEPHAPSGKTGRPPFAVSTMLRFGKTPSPGHLLEEHNLSIQLMATINAALATRGLMLKVGFTKVRYRGLAKNTAQLITLFALSNLWMARRQILQGAQG